MAGISPTGGVRPPMMPNAAELSARRAEAQPKPQFARMLKTYVEQVDQQQHASYDAVKDLIAGRRQDIVPVVHAVAEADMGFKLLMGVRNKVIEAYKQTMNMQI